MGYFDTDAPNGGDTDVVSAGVVPYTGIDYPTRRITRDTPEDVDLKDWYRNCGPVRIAVNTTAATVAQYRFPVQVDRGLGWEWADSPRMQAIMRAFVGRNTSQEKFIESLAVSLRVPGHAYLVLRNDEGRQPFYDLVQSCALKPVFKEPGWAEYSLSRRGRKPGDYGYRRASEGYIHHIYSEDPEYPADAWSPLHAAFDSVDRYKRAYRHVGRTLDSKMAMSNILWVKATNMQSDWKEQVFRWNQEAIEHDDGQEAISPFLMSTAEKPEFIKNDTEAYDMQLQIAVDAAESIARDLDFPTAWMIEGPGQAKYDNEDATWEWYLDNSTKPLAEQVADIMTRKHLRPFIDATPLGEGEDAVRWRVWYDDSHLRKQDDNTDMLFQAGREGFLSEKKFAEVLGVHVNELAHRPAGVSWEEYVHSVNGRSLADLNAEEAEVLELEATVVEPDEPLELVAADIAPPRRIAPRQHDWGALI